ncbi:MAG: NAD(P)H-dependent oxidoreductase [Pseudomonadota bacterium]
MRALVVYAHPKEGSYNAAIRDLILARIEGAGGEARLIDLYARGFDPRLTAAELDGYEDLDANMATFGDDIEALRWCDTLIFVYPTWWYGLPAILKGWLDRAWVPGVAFLMPDENGDIRPGLTNVKRIAAFTTCGASWWLTRLVGAPGKATLLRGLRVCCAKTCRTTYAAHYLMDSSTPESRARHLARVGRKMDRLLGARHALKEATA